MNNHKPGPVKTLLTNQYILIVDYTTEYINCCIEYYPSKSIKHDKL